MSNAGDKPVVTQADEALLSELLKAGEFWPGHEYAKRMKEVLARHREQDTLSREGREVGNHPDLEGHIADAVRDACNWTLGKVVSFDESRGIAATIMDRIKIANAEYAAALSPPASEGRDVGRDMFDSEPSIVAHSPEPSLRCLVRKYYNEHFIEERADELTEQYFAALSTAPASPEQADQADVLRERIAELEAALRNIEDDTRYVNNPYAKSAHNAARAALKAQEG